MGHDYILYSLLFFLACKCRRFSDCEVYVMTGRTSAPYSVSL